MLKFAFLLLFLLNSVQISTANSTIEEQQKLNATIELFNMMADLDGLKEKLKEMTIHGAKLYEVNEKMNALDGIPLQSGWVNESHVELCPGYPVLRDSNSSELSSYNCSFLIHYDIFDIVLSEIPESETDFKKIKTISYQFSDEKTRMEVAQKAHEFSQRLQCLQRMKPSNNTEFIEKMADLYEAYSYSDKFSQKQKAKKNNKLISKLQFFIVVAVFLALCVWVASS